MHLKTVENAHELRTRVKYALKTRLSRMQKTRLSRMQKTFFTHAKNVFHACKKRFSRVESAWQTRFHAGNMRGIRVL